jgi:hypothetical protein
MLKNAPTRRAVVRRSWVSIAVRNVKQCKVRRISIADAAIPVAKGKRVNKSLFQ